MSARSSPSGTVTFLFTDIAGSTRMWEQHPDLMRPSLARHAVLLHAAIEAHAGHVFKTVGDAFCAAFQTAPDALAAALAGQRALAAEPWPDETPIRVRIGLHTGVADAESGDYFGQTLNRVARLMSAGYGGQTLLSAAAWELVRDDLPDGVTLRDLGERRLKDLRRPERIYQLLADGLPADFPPLATLDARPNNLPVQLTSFVGREREMADVKRLLKTSHLVTLTGIGGTGKTRLALQAAADLIDDFDHGVWFVDLAPLTDPALVASSVATVLGVKEEPGRMIEETLIDNLKSKRLLMILDNCEHLVTASASLADALLRRAPGVRILATSRVRLNVAGEARLAVPPLAVPDPASGSAHGADVVATLKQFEAVRLFIDRAVAVKSDFVVTNASAPAVAGICQRLDGIPLAIELAAARVLALSPDQIATRLDDRFQLLTGGSRSALPRQQTLRAAIDWSHDLLPESERVLLRRLAVFHGGWTLEAAEGVSAGDGLDASDVLDLLARLVEQSLIQAELDSSPPRYQFLETIRDYSAEQLALAGETHVVRDRHLGWHERLAAGFDPGYGNPDWIAWIDRLEREHDNLRAAMSWGLAEPGRVRQVMQLIRPLWALWQEHGHLREGREWYERTHRLAIDIGLDVSQRRDFGWVSYGLSVLLWPTGSLDQAEVRAREARRCFELIGERRGVAWTVTTLGAIALHHRDFAQAEASFLSSLELLRELGVPPAELAAVLTSLGEVARAKGDLRQADIYFRDCLAEDPNQGWAHHNLGHVLLRQGEVVEAEAHFSECLTIAGKLGNPVFLAATLGGFAGLVVAQHRPQRAARLFGAAATLLERGDVPLAGTDQVDWDHNVAAARAQQDAAAWESAWAEGQAMSAEEAIALAMAGGTTDDA